MSITEVVLMVAVLALAGWVLYRSFLKKKGTCAGCTSCACGGYKTVSDNRPISRRTDEKNLFSKKDASIICLTVVVVAVLGVLLASRAAYAGHPLITDDAGTMGKGKGQIEIGVQSWNHKEAVDATTTDKTDGGEAAPVITFGLHERVDLVATIPYQWWSTETNGTRVSRADGIADVGLDLKWRFFNHDGWGLALKPGVSFPTGNEEQGLGSGRMAYRLFFIATKELGALACHLNLGYIRNENNAGDQKDLWRASFAAEYEVVKNLKVMANVGTERNPAPDSSTHPAFALGGAAYALSERISVDGGVKFGLNKAEPDVTYLFGMTFKFF